MVRVVPWLATEVVPCCWQPTDGAATDSADEPSGSSPTTQGASRRSRPVRPRPTARDYNATTNPGKFPRTAVGRECNSAGQSHYRRTPGGTGRDRIALTQCRFSHPSSPEKPTEGSASGPTARRQAERGSAFRVLAAVRAAAPFAPCARPAVLAVAPDLIARRAPEGGASPGDGDAERLRATINVPPTASSRRSSVGREGVIWPDSIRDRSAWSTPARFAA